MQRASSRSTPASAVSSVGSPHTFSREPTAPTPAGPWLRWRRSPPARLIWLAVQSAGLYPDEAQYWFWAQHPAFGYYSKPPLVAWLIWLTTAAFGDSEFAIRLSAPLLHAGAAGIVYAIAARLYDRRTGFWSALAYVTLPGVSLSAFIISTDAVLLPCWAAALYAFIRAREPGGERWWLVAGIAAGAGLLAKYAMAYWFLSAFGFVLLAPAERRHLRPLFAATGIAVLILSAQFVVELEPWLCQLSASARQCRSVGHLAASGRLPRVPRFAVRRHRAVVFRRL